MTTLRVDFPYLSPEPDRHGNERLYVRRNGRRIRIREVAGTPEFAAAYAHALEALEAPQPPKRVARTAAALGTVGWLAARYFDSAEFRGLDPVSQRTRRAIIEECLREPRKPSAAETMAQCPVRLFTSAHVRVIRDRKADKKGAANNRLKYLSALFGWAVETGHVAVNPTRDVRRLRYATDGFHTWTPDEVRRFEARHPIGTKARLALAMLLFLGVRRSDVVTLGRQHRSGETMRFVPRKTRHRRLTMVSKPILPDLAAILAVSPCGDLAYLTTEYGRPFTAAGFGAWFRKRCNEAGLPQCSAHGLRKAGATLAAERGATGHQLMAIYDWATVKQADPYTREADRRRLTAEAMPLLASKPGT